MPMRPLAAAALALVLVGAQYFDPQVRDPLAAWGATDPELLRLSTQDAKKDRLRETLKDTGLVGPWIYDDVEAGFAEAKKGGKPVLIVFR